MGCTCNKSSNAVDSTANATCNKADRSIYYHPQISVDLQNTRIDQVLHSTLLNNVVPNIEQVDNFTITKVSRDEEQRIIMSFKRWKEYETVSSVLAILSHKDPSTLTTINSNSVNDTLQIHIPSDLVKSKGNGNINFGQYTNEKGYSKVLHLIHHGSLKKTNNIHHRPFSYYVETNGLNGDNLFKYVENTNNGGLYTTTKLNFDSTRKVIKDILYAIKYLHDRNIVHRNIYPGRFEFNASNDTIKKLMDRDEDSDYHNKKDHCSLVLSGYTSAYCFDPNNFNLSGNVEKDDSKNADRYSDHDHQDIETKWKEMMQKHLSDQIGTASYCSPEVAFDWTLHQWARHVHPSRTFSQLSAEEQLVDIEHFTKMIREKYDKNIKLHDDGFELDMKQRYNCERLFGMSWQERYKKWKNYDTLPVLENDNLNKDLWQRYPYRTPRSFKASDIWGVGVIAYKSLTGISPFGAKTINDIMESIITTEYKVPSNHKGQDCPLIFSVELTII